MGSLEKRSLVRKHLDAGIEAREEPSDPGSSNALCESGFESRDRRLREPGSSGKRALAQAALPAELSEDLAEHLQGLPCWFVQPADRPRHGRIKLDGAYRAVTRDASDECDSLMPADRVVGRGTTPLTVPPRRSNPGFGTRSTSGSATRR